jgi:O-antigen ligase
MANPYPDAVMTSQLAADGKLVLRLALTAGSRRYVIAACIAALAFGIFLPIAPWAAVAWLAVIPLAFAAPVWALAVLVAVTVLVPWGVQDTLKVIGGPGQRGLLFVDVLMLLGLVRLGWLVVRRRLEVDLPLLGGTFVAGVCTFATLWGIERRADLSEVGQDSRRVLLGVGTFLLAWPLMANRSTRLRLAWVLIGLGLVLGIWGLAQWVFSVGYTNLGDFGVMQSGRAYGQLQGGMYAFPVAVALACAALVADGVRTAAVKYLLAVVLSLNAVCVLLTFERTIWVATAVACVFLVVTSGARALAFASRWAWIGVAVLVVAAAIAPAGARMAHDRWALLGRVATDNSFKWRSVESHVVADEISARPVTGSGFGATITWGVRDTFATMTTPYAHNGYLWLAWKIGIPAAAIVVLLLGRAFLRRCPSEDTAEWHALRKGSQAALLALLLTCLTFPVFDELAITAVLGFLVAVCYSRPDPSPVPTPLGRPL